MFICDCKQAIDTEYKPKSRQDLLIKHILELAKTSHQSKHFTLVGGRLATIARADCISLVLEQPINIGQKLAGKEPL